MKWQTTKQTCNVCGYVQVSVHPSTCEYLECANCHHMNPAPYLDDAENVIDAVIDPRRKTWRKVWAWFAVIHIAALIPLWWTGNWLAIWFCGCVVYYCLMARHRESQP